MSEISGRTQLDRTILLLTGGDRVRYLNGQITNDVRRISADEATYACVTNAKGKLEADIFFSVWEDESILIDGPASCREELFARLFKYIISDDADLEDVTEDFVMHHALGEAPETTVGTTRSALRYGVSGSDLILPADEALPEAWAALPEISANELEELRIRHGIAVWGAELGPDTLPQEAHLQDRAIDFHKGCYIGQEVISRIKSVGRVNRQLKLLLQQNAEPLKVGWEFRDGEKVIGQITSLIRPKADGPALCLGYLRHTHATTGQALTAFDPENNLSSLLEIQEIPFR